jgi:hypothetical protein
VISVAADSHGKKMLIRQHHTGGECRHAAMDAVNPCDCPENAGVLAGTADAAEFGDTSGFHAVFVKGFDDRAVMASWPQPAQSVESAPLYCANSRPIRLTFGGGGGCRRLHCV